MGYVITIPPQIRVRRTAVILDPEKDLRELIDTDLGMDAAELYDSVIRDKENPYSEGDDYEAIADGYRGMLVDVMNDLHEIISQNRLNRKRLEEVYENLNKNL